MQGYAGYEISCSPIWRLSFRESFENQKLCCISSPTPAQLCPVSGQDFIFVLRTFAMERLLYRLSRSPYVDNFVLKGAMLFKLWTGDFYRQTRDIDVLAIKSQTIDSLKAIFKDFPSAAA
jgi:hypothetical protein